MDLDDVDIGILAFLSDVPDSTTTAIAKALFKPPYNLGKLDCFVRYRLKRLTAEGVVNPVKQSRVIRYSIDEKKVFFGEGLLEMDGLGKLDMGYFVVIKKEDEIIAKSIDDYEKRIGAKKLS